MLVLLEILKGILLFLSGYALISGKSRRQYYYIFGKNTEVTCFGGLIHFKLMY